MTIIMKRGTEPNEGGVYVKMFTAQWQTYSRVDGLIAALEAVVPMEGGLVIGPHAIVAGPDGATQTGQAALSETSTGYTVALAAGDRAGDIWSLLVASVAAGTIAADWLVEVSSDGDLLRIHDPALLAEDFPNDANMRKMQVDWKMRLRR